VGGKMEEIIILSRKEFDDLIKKARNWEYYLEQETLNNIYNNP